MNKPIRVLHTEWSGGWGGQEVRIIQEMLAVREHGVEVFLSSTSHAKITEQAKQHGIKTFDLPYRGNWDLKTLFGLIKIIRAHKINIVNTHSGKDTWVGGFAAKLTGAKFIRTRHLSNPVRKSPLNFINKMADYLITTGETVRQEMIRDNGIRPENSASIPTGVDPEVYQADRYDRAANRQKFGILDNEIAIGIVAILRSFKRHDLFIDMAKQLVGKHPNVKFFIAGDGPKHDEILAKIKAEGLEQKVILTGYVKNPAELLSALDIFTLTSDRFEGVPQAVMQALMMQLPVVATSAGSTGDLHHDDNFILIEPGKLEPIVNAVELLINDANKCDYYRARARDYVVEKFSRKVMTHRLLDIYQKLLKE
jgi:glycosyltransferase involved in cell wall biosynthesis